MAVKYLDAKRIRGSSTADKTPDYSTTFGATTGWRTNQTHVFIDTGNNMLEFELDDDSTDEYINYDLGSGNVSNDSWILRYELVFSTLNLSSNDVNNALIVGIMDNATPSGLVSSGDAVTYNTQVTNSSIANVLSCVNGGSQSKADVNNDPFSSSTATGTTFYVEIKRVSATSTEQRVYSTSDYSTTQVGTTMSRSTSSAVTALRYLTVQVQNGAFGGSGYTGHIKNLKFYNDTTTTTQDDKATLITSYADSLGTAGDATSNSGDLVTSGHKLGTGCLNFDGDGGSPANDNIDCFAALDSMEGTGSVSLWFNSDTSQERILWSVQDASASVGLEVKTRTDGKCAINGSGGGMNTLELVSTETFTDTNWVHLVITQDGTNCKIYVNGTVGQSGTDNGQWIEDISGIDGGKFGCKPPRNSGSASEGFNGKLDDIGIWDRALTSTEVGDLYGNGTTTMAKATTIPSGLKVYYSCDSATVTNELADYSDLPENTLFEETDTYKTYWLQSDSTWMEKHAPVTYMVMMGGASGKADDIQRITVATSGNSVDFGEMNNGCEKPAGVSNNTRGCACGGEAPSEINDIQYVTIGTLGNATDFGNLTTTAQRSGGVSDVSNDKGIIGGGYRNGSLSTVIDYFAIATTGNASAFGNTTQARSWIAGCWSETRGCFCNGYTSTSVDTIDYITMATGGTATDFGDSTKASYSSSATTNLTRGVICGGYEENGSNRHDVISYITIATTGNATDFGDLMETNQTIFCGGDLKDKAVLGGGAGNQDRIQTFTISTTGNATNFGSMVNDKHDGCTVNGS